MSRVLERVRGRHSFAGRPGKLTSPTLLERLEPRILLSGDSLLHATYALLDDPLDSNAQQTTQYAELPNISVDVGEQAPIAGQETDKNSSSSDGLDTNLLQSVLTLSVSIEDASVVGADQSISMDDNTSNSLNDTLLDAASSDDIGLIQTGENAASPMDDSSGGTKNNVVLAENVQTATDFEVTSSLAVTSDDGTMPIYISDADPSVAYATSIDIRGPPVGATVSGEETTIPVEDRQLSDYALIFRTSASQNDLTLRLSVDDATVLELVENGQGVILVSWSLPRVTCVVIEGSDHVDDALTVDFSRGSAV